MLIRIARRTARRSLNKVEQILHPGRRRRAIEALREAAPFKAVVFICYGNICRSPYAEVLFREALPEVLRDAYEISSAGFYGDGRRSPSLAIEVAGERGIDLMEHRSTNLSRVSVARTELAVVMSTEQRRGMIREYGWHPGSVLILGDLDPEPIERRTIKDPYAHAKEVFESSYDRVDRCVEVLLGVLTQKYPGESVATVTASADQAPGA